jgi:sphingomyelin phosphodiesterase acid-like 3
MKTMLFRRVAIACAVLALSMLPCASAGGQARRSAAAQSTVSALMLSDIHFDPFHDPAKTRRLASAPVEDWNHILEEPPSADQAAAFTALQERCAARGVDTPFALLQSSLEAEHRAAPLAKFITVSGDLVAHNFTCRYVQVFSRNTPSDYAAFVEKTIDYVIGEVRRTFPGVPVYVALGNNDSNCGDNRLDGGSDFLAAVGKSVVAALPESADRENALADFTASGSYTVMMAAPMRNTRLIVLDDLFMLTQYTTCGGKQDRTVAEEQIGWLRQQLAAARLHKQRVWVMGHIPPGVDVYSTFAKMRNVCGSDAPAMFLASDNLTDVLREYADVVRLGIFAHTHMDELRLLPRQEGAKGPAVAIKMVSSISPVNGNDPSFTVARVDTASAMLKDYAVFVASNKTGSDATWSKEYDYSQAYYRAVFSAPELEKLMIEFKADPDAKKEESKEFIRYFVPGDTSSLIKPLWPQYVCALGHATANGFAVCMCSAGH